MINEDLILSILKRCWSKESSSLWTKDNPAKGQCGVTALVINNFYGGEILKTKLSNGQPHFYNLINGKRYDFTKSQFVPEIEYSDDISTKEEAFKDTNIDQLNYLLNAFGSNL